MHTLTQTPVLHRKEIPVLLNDQTEFSLLVQHFKLQNQQKHFKNYFFDTESLLIYHAGAALYARQYLNESDFTLSLMLDQTKRERDHLVLPSAPIAELENLKRDFTIPNGNFLFNVSQITGLEDVFFKGSMRVERYYIEQDYGFVKIDKSTFSEGKIDLEFKISVKPGKEEIAEEIFHKELCVPYGLTPDPFTIPKYQRFLSNAKLIKASKIA